MNGMPSCEDCRFYQLESVEIPGFGLASAQVCVAEASDQCPIEAEHIAEETGVPYCDYCHHRHFGYEDHYLA